VRVHVGQSEKFYSVNIKIHILIIIFLLATEKTSFKSSVIKDFHIQENVVDFTNMQIHCDLFEDTPSTSVPSAKPHFTENKIAAIIAADGRSKSVLSKMKWAENVFHRWMSGHNNVTLSTMRINHFVDFIPKYIMEVRKDDGGCYPPNTLFDLIIYLQQSINRSHNTKYNFLSDDCFKPIKLVLDAEMKRLQCCGVGIKRKQAEVIDIDSENDMWIDNILGEDTPKQLVNTIIYLLGLNLALRGRVEHRQLQWDNFEFKNTVIIYTENISKTNIGGLRGRKVKGKMVEIHSNETDHLRCPVRLFKKYAALCPGDREMESPVYLSPLKKPNKTCWYSKIPLGINSISKATTTIMKQHNCEGYFTNHSLRRTAITRLYNHGIDEKRICETSGHRSTAVRDYQITGERMRKEISQVIQGNGNSVIISEECQGATASGSVHTLETSNNLQNKPKHNFSGTFYNCTFQL
jgi:integrase